MKTNIIVASGLAAVLVLPVVPAGAADALTAFQKKVRAVMDMPHRSNKNRLRDRNRDPVKALHFCRMRDDMTVLDWAPGRGWYTEILGPLLKDNGLLYVSTQAARLKRLDGLLKKEPMSKVRKLPVDVIRHPVSHDITAKNLDFGLTGVDLVLNFREYHNLDPSTRLDFNRAVHKALKPGGYYCIIDHTRRHMEPDTNENRRRVDPVLAIKEVQAAGFEFVDFATFFLRPDDELRFEVGRRTVRGNTDRFTLLFRKPAP
ncbi:MAG: methyltransferase [Alphaproteobacteria bacterium]|nr:methyltransferase [Alphaproteobacteria bacterium]